MPLKYGDSANTAQRETSYFNDYTDNDTPKSIGTMTIVIANAPRYTCKFGY
ncbi:MAG: hypothetical protein P8M20_09200 [Planctomycetaceae bacterium]|nr:hypothetical protein [Planctomycetaceae bacterium]